MNTGKHILAAVLLLCAASVGAQGIELGKQVNREVLRMGLYPPDLLMRHQQRLGITDDQRSAIAALVGQFQQEVTELQWSIPAERQQLQDLLTRPQIDSKAALKEAQGLLAKEADFKLAHFRLLIAIKTELTEQQIEMIDQAIRRRIADQP